MTRGGLERPQWIQRWKVSRTRVQPGTVNNSHKTLTTKLVVKLASLLTVWLVIVRQVKHDR